MKQEKDWYKNIIIYTGDSHTVNLKRMLLEWSPVDPLQKFKLMDHNFKIDSKCISYSYYKDVVDIKNEIKKTVKLKDEETKYDFKFDNILLDEVPEINFKIYDEKFDSNNLPSKLKPIDSKKI